MSDLFWGRYELLQGNHVVIQFPFLQTIHNYKEKYYHMREIIVVSMKMDDINEEILQDFRRRDVELHVPYNPNTPAAAQERRAYLTEELHHL